MVKVNRHQALTADAKSTFDAAEKHVASGEKPQGAPTRRAFLRSAGAAIGATSLLATNGCSDADGDGYLQPEGAADYWGSIRGEFVIDPDYVHLAGMLITPHPRAVREAVARHRDGLDRNPTNYLSEHNARLRQRSRQAAADYIGAEMQDVGLVDSTTMGAGMVYNGLHVREDQELLASEHEHFSTQHALDLKAVQTGAKVRRIPLYQEVRKVSADELVQNLVGAITPRTRVLACTWVHSKTGLKLPIRQIAEQVAEVNTDRAPEDRVLLCVDGVHGFGVEDHKVPDIGCDFFFAGTHKWIFAPRGTGIVWGRPEAQSQISPIIPTFAKDETWGASMTPGGFQAFEHQWSMAEAFGFHQQIGKRSVRDRIHALARHAKEELSKIEGVTLWTPMDESLSSGIICFDVAGLSPHDVVQRLAERRIIASATPYTPTHARFSPGLLNTEEEIDWALQAVRAMV